MNLHVSAARIAADIDALAAITDPDRPWTRRAFTPRFLEGRAWLSQAFAAAGLAIRIDDSGNLIGWLAGVEAGLGTIMLGSHSDTVPAGGRFDGVAGVVVALEVARALREQGVRLRHDLEIVDFLAEEVSIFGVSCAGSRGMAGVRPSDWLAREKDGQTLAAAIDAAGGRATAENFARKDISAFLELHIEQGPVLEAEKKDIGLVSAIVGITRIEIEVTGRADHAGTTPMSTRRDALVAAADLVSWIDRRAKTGATRGGHFTATTGEFDMQPNAANVVPAHVRMLIDARAEIRADMDRFLHDLDEAVTACAVTRNVAAAMRVASDNPPTILDSHLLDLLDQSCASVGAAARRMASGAGHDAAWIARVAPAAMVFVPCRDGRSHAPEEFAETADIALGAAVLLETVKRVDAEK